MATAITSQPRNVKYAANLLLTAATVQIIGTLQVVCITRHAQAVYTASH